MGDSDEEYNDRRSGRGRDKFRRERSDFQDRGGRDDRGRRDDWQERDSRNRRDYRDYDPRNRRDRYSPQRDEISPPMKRNRRNWEDRGGGYGNNFESNFPPPAGGGMMGGMHNAWGGGGGGMNQQRDSELLTQPPMMTLKLFLANQEDTIDVQEAVKKYNEYKLDFKRQQINDFYVTHKDEEWFKLKHHPEESLKRKAELREAQKRRLEAFMDLYEKGWVSDVHLDQEHTEKIIRFLDAVVIKLEGGSDIDLKALDEPTEEERAKELAAQLPPADSKPEQTEDKGENSQTPEKTKKKKTRHSKSPGSGEGSSSSSESEEDSMPPANDKDKEAEKMNGVTIKQEALSPAAAEKDKDDSFDKSEKDGDEVLEKEAEEISEKEAEEISEKDAEEISEKDAEDGLEKDGQEPSEQEVLEEVEEVQTDKDAEKESSQTVEEEENNEPKPRALHKTYSIFLRYLAPSITKLEVETMCKRFPGFLRLAIADPQPERRFFRRAWITFERSVNIKEICWKLNTIRLRDTELGAIVNRDLSRRIRSVNGISFHKQVVRTDIKLAARIILNLDKQKKLWEQEEGAAAKPDETEEQGLLASKNPLLKNITDYLIEEASAEEEELLGVGENDDQKGEDGCTLERDEALIEVLDRMLLYLRVVHSVDYYNCSEYPSEDEMPNRCGILHARGAPTSGRVTQSEITEYVSNFESRSGPFLQEPSRLSEEEAEKLGKKNSDAEVEKFIESNSQELGKEKWLCPLSGKKFKGPEFIRKHIFNKHMEKIDEVKREVEYFNDYLMDPKRYHLPEHPSNRPPPASRPEGMPTMGMPPYGAPFHPPMPHYYGPRGPNFQGFGGNFNRGHDMFNRNNSGGGFKRNFNRKSPRDPRKVITYRDLDAPEDDMDTF